MIPVSTLYDEYIERRKFTEQKKKKPSWVYSSSPLKRVGTIKLVFPYVQKWRDIIY